MKQLSKLFLFSTTLLLIFNNANSVNLPKDITLADKQSLKLYLISNPATLDPTLSADGPSAQIIRQLFDSLVRWDQEKGEYVNNGAESYTQSDDLKTWTFYLNKNAVWSDGKPVTAYDYVYAWRRLVDPNVASNSATLLSNYLNIVNADDIIKGNKKIEELGIKAIDDYTFQVTTTVPIPWFYSTLSGVNFAPIRQDIIEKYGNKWTLPENIVVNGPFKLDKYIVNEILELSKNEKYFNADKVVITNISWPIISSRLAAYNRFISKEIDIAYVPKEMFEKTLKDGYEIKTILRDVVFGLRVNLAIPKLQDIRVREALRLVIDNELIISKVIRNNNIPLYSWIPKSIIEAEEVKEPNFGSMNERIEKAKRLISEAGYSKSNPLKISFLYSTGDIEKRLFITYQQQIHKHLDGVVIIALENLEWKVFLEKVAKKEFEVSDIGHGASHASGFVADYLSKSTSNYISFSSKEFDGLYTQVLNTKDVKERAKLFAKMDHLLVSSYSIIPINQGASNVLVNPKLKGYDTKNEDRYIIDYYFVK